MFDKYQINLIELKGGFLSIESIIYSNMYKDRLHFLSVSYFSRSCLSIDITISNYQKCSPLGSIPDKFNETLSWCGPGICILNKTPRHFLCTKFENQCFILLHYCFCLTLLPFSPSLQKSCPLLQSPAQIQLPSKQSPPIP